MAYKEGREHIIEVNRRLLLTKNRHSFTIRLRFEKLQKQQEREGLQEMHLTNED